MAVSIGKGRYYKLFPGTSPPKRLLIEDITEPGLISDEYVQGIVAKVCPIKCSERYGKLCKLVLKEDVENRTRHSQCAIINVFLLGDVADEGCRICEGDRVVLSEVIAECSPTDEHHLQLIVWREKSQASLWVINHRGKVRANTVNGVTSLPVSSEEDLDVEKSTAAENDSSDEVENVIYESCEYNFTQQAADNTQLKVGEKRKGKTQLGPRGVTPSQVKRSMSNMVVLLEKIEGKQMVKTLQQEESYSNSASTCTNASVAGANVGNVNVSTGNPVNNCMPSIAVEAGGQSMVMSQKPAPGGNGQSLSLSIQSANPTAEQPANVQCTHIELTPSGVSTRIWNGQTGTQPGQLRDACQFGAMTKDLPQLLAPDSQGHSQSTVVEGNKVESVEGANTGAAAGAGASAGEDHTKLTLDDLQEQPSEDCHMPADEEDLVFISPRKLSSNNSIRSQGSPAKGIPPHFRVADEDLTPTSSTKSLIPNDYTPAASLLACNEGGVKRTPLQQVLDSKRMRTFLSPEAGPSRRSPSPDRAANTFPARVRKRSSRAAADYIVPPGYTTLANLQPETTVNVYGVVKLFKPAWKCRGTDMCSVLMLMDPTVAESGGLECVSFQPSVSRLPNVQKVGDIVRLHRIKISQYQGRLQAKSSRGFAAVVFDRDTELPVTPEAARVSSSTFTLTQGDKDTVESLKNWCEVHPVLFPPTNFLTVAQISPDTYFDLVCEVLGMALHRTLDCVVLYVTDGTQPKHDLRTCDGDDYNVVEPLGNHSVQDDDVISIFLYGSHAEVARLLARRGGFLILHNVHSQVLKQGGSVCSVLDVVKPYLELCVHRGTAFGRGISMLSPDSPEVKHLKRNQGF